MVQTRQNDVFKSRDNVWLQDIMVNMHNYNGTIGVKYKLNIDGVLRNKLLDKIAKKAIERCGMIEDISKMIYHRLNQGTDGQEVDAFETMSNSKKLTIYCNCIIYEIEYNH